jgi:hypothetical protein
VQRRSGIHKALFKEGLGKLVELARAGHSTVTLEKNLEASFNATVDDAEKYLISQLGE